MAIAARRLTHAGEGSWGSSRGIVHEDDINILGDQLVCKFPELVGVFGPAEFDSDVLALDITEAVQAGSQRFYASCCSSGRPEAQVANVRYLRWLLGASGDWRSEDAADEPDELPPPHSMTSSARASRDGGTVRPSDLAVLRFMTSSNLVGCSTGRSLGFAPLKILSTRTAARRYRSG